VSDHDQDDCDQDEHTGDPDKVVRPVPAERTELSPPTRNGTMRHVGTAEMPAYVEGRDRRDDHYAHGAPNTFPVHHVIAALEGNLPG
jgi:hypothetical protein